MGLFNLLIHYRPKTLPLKRAKCQTTDDDDFDLLGMPLDKIDSELMERDNIIKSETNDIETLPKTFPSDEDILLEVDDLMKKSTPMDRIYNIWVIDPYLGMSNERIILNILPTAVFVLTASYFSSLAISENSRKFILDNKATAWTTALKAKKKFHDFVLGRSFLQGYKYGIKATLLVTGVFVSHTIITAYNGRTTFWDFGVAAAIPCSLYCFNMGLRGMVAGATLTGIPGLLMGTGHYFYRHATNTTYEQTYRKRLIQQLMGNRELQQKLMIPLRSV